VSYLETALQRTILFLIADTGAGHRSSANAIRNAMDIISQREREAADPDTPPPNYRIEIVDVFEEYGVFPLREAMKLYGPAIRYNPKIYGQIFHASNREGVMLGFDSLTTPLILNGLMRLFTTVQPDIIVSVHPLVNFVTVRAIQQLRINVPFMTVVTDLVSVHFSWFAPGVDGYIVPTEEAKKLYLKRGLDSKKVQVLGQPIDPKFARPVASKQELREKFNLQPGLPAVLLVGGGDGAGGLRAAVRAISDARLPVQLMVVTGRNRRLYANLQSTRSRLHIPSQIFGFVNNMPELMHAADVIVTKAGPGTICEALACNLPIILSGYVPGQEEGNVEYVVSNRVGVLAGNPASLVDALRRLIVPGSPELRRWRESAQRLSRPLASFDIAQSILNKLEQSIEARGGKALQWQKRQRRMSGRLQSAIRLRQFGRHLRFPTSRRYLKNILFRRNFSGNE
jgi:1,2-diacylglycerol 3-beta-galactosyltransferase